jgi:gliding motility-associated-like protein
MKHIKFSLLFLFFLLQSNIVFPFTLSTTFTNETCSGNGEISFTVLNTDPNGTILYIVYLLPNVTTPYATTSSNILSGLAAGTYRVVARETIGSTFTTQQADVIISNTTVPLTYTVLSFNQACSSTSTISINVNTGNAVSYEIINGPVIFPLQASNTFSNLPIGIYKIRVFDSCGIGVVTTYTVVINSTGLSVSNPVQTNTTCTSTEMNQTIIPANGTVIAYPLTVQYTLHPPSGGADIIINQIIQSGNLFSLPISETFPVYINQGYTYDLSITDACNATFTDTYTVNTNITLSVAIQNLPCNEYYFTLNTTNFASPYTLNFTSFPSGFNPVLFNANYPTPYSTSATDFGNATNVVPFGNYSVSITDICGSTASLNFSIISKPPEPAISAFHNGCLTNSGTISATIIGYTLLSVVVTSAPASYPNPLPDNVSSQIVNNVLTLNPVPLGSYTLELVENCTNTILPATITVPIYVDQGVDKDLRPGCELGKGSVKIWSKNGKLNTVTIIAAPVAYPFTLPDDVSNEIVTNGELYLSDLPAGTYTFTTIDECNFNNTFDVTVVGYALTTNAYSLIANCGSFDIPLQFISNGTTNQTFWLQKLINLSTNEWGNPITGVEYVDTSIPNSTNSILLTNLTTNYNFSFNGTFRIVRHFLTYNSGTAINSGGASSANKSCIEILSPTLSFNEALEITNGTRMPCNSSGTLDVMINATGTLPLHYTITQKNGLPFSLDNGISNIFYGLPSAIYTFQIEDSCGNIVNRIIDINSLTSLVLITKPSDLLICTDTITNSETFDLTSQNSIILGSQNPSEYTLSYYISLSEAQLGVNAQTSLNNYNPITNPETIYARLIYNGMPSCYEITSFDLFVGQNPKITLDENYLFCDQNSVTIDASGLNLSSTTYSWSNGSTGSSITIATPGITELTLTATNTYGAQNLKCTDFKSITVVLSESPVIEHIDTIDWTQDDNSITVITSNNSAFEYSLDNNLYQSGNVFSNLSPGLYTVYVKDKAGCGFIMQKVWLLYYLKYFTPNGDGFNETWRIPFSENEKDLKIVIYDRYGKFVTSFSSNSIGWDGTYNGNMLFSDDYWFEVFRQDGKIHRGHFCLKR